MKSGAVLVLLLVFMAMSITITTAATLLTISASQSSSRQDLSYVALAVAETGLEDTLMRHLRDPGFAGVSTLTVGSGVATINISSADGIFTFTSTGQFGRFIRTVRAVASDSEGIMNVTAWNEIFP